MKGSNPGDLCVRSARCIGSWPRNQPVRERRNVTIPSTPSPSWWPRGLRTCSNLVLGHHQAWGRRSRDVLADQGVVLGGHLQPHASSAGWSPTGTPELRKAPGRSSHGRQCESPRRPTNSWRPATRSYTLHLEKGDRGAPMTSKWHRAQRCSPTCNHSLAERAPSTSSDDNPPSPRPSSSLE